MARQTAKFDQIWIDNRFRYRKGMKGSTMRKDVATGYLEPKNIRGFNAEMKKTFIQRYSVCDNKSAIAKSLFVDIQSVWDAIALDEKFRTDIIKCDQIISRKHRLNDSLVELANSEKTNTILELSRSLEKYGLHG